MAISPGRQRKKKKKVRSIGLDTSRTRRKIVDDPTIPRTTPLTSAERIAILKKIDEERKKKNKARR